MIDSCFNSVTGTLTLVSEAGATVSQFQAALRHVTYQNMSTNPSKVARTVGWQVSDGVVLESLVTSSIIFV